MLLTTTPSIEGKSAREYLGIVTGEAIIGANILKDIMAALTGTYTVTMDTERQDDGSNTPRIWTGTFTDIPGFTHIDEFGRYRGGSSIVLTFAGGSFFMFEKQ